MRFDIDDDTFDSAAAETPYPVTDFNSLHRFTHFDTRFPSASIHIFDLRIERPQSQVNTHPSPVTVLKQYSCRCCLNSETS